MATLSPILERNLAALQVFSPHTAELIRRTPARGDVSFLPADDGAMSAETNGRALCSRRRPLDEAARLAGTVDVAAAAGVVALGFGLGHHVRAMLEKLARTGVVFVFEPDIGLLRAVLERVDHSGWLISRSIVFLHDPGDIGAISQATRGVEALLAMGVAFLEHPADRVRLGDLSVRFQTNFTGVYRAIRTTVVTTLVQSDVTLRNLMMNLDRYATCPGLAELENACRGRPAIVVSAGPSLRRNIDLLSRAGIRERFVIIAVQTVLKLLLSKGIRPHFVTALDYHEISRRFYEGLTPQDVEGVTLVAMPWANPAILESFPGRICIPEDWTPDRERLPEHLAQSADEILGPELRIDRKRLEPGQTVAHMAYYVARWMGCDPVVLIGQDLGFTDGQYYSAGAAMHQVWSGELSPFRSLEMLEWERIARFRHHLHRATDTLGRPIYTDEQMATYRVQFERDFGADAARGLTVIDATEGGVAKQGAPAMTLGEALARFMPATLLHLPEPAAPPDPRSRLTKLGARVRSLRSDVWKVEDASRRGAAVLKSMLEADPQKANAMVERVQAIGAEATALRPAFGLVQRLNQTGVFKRAKADRQIEVERTLTPVQRQRRQIERDIMNLTWTGDAAAGLGTLLEQTAACLDGAPKLTRDLDPSEDDAPAGGAPATRVAVLITLDEASGGLATSRNLGEPVAGDRNALQLTLRRLNACRSIDTVLILAADIERARAIAGDAPRGLTVEFGRADVRTERRRAIGAARAWSRSCWRGGIAGMSVYDEVCDPVPMLEAMEAHGLDAAVLVGADWSLVDPALVDETVARYRQRPKGEGANRLTFCQAPPGLGACLVERSLMREFVEREAQAGVFASIGGLLGYIPVAPQSDPIAKSVCVAPPAHVRDAGLRFIADTAEGRDLVAKLVEAAGGDADAPALCAAAAGLKQAIPTELMLELCTGRLAPRRAGEAPERPVLSTPDALRLIREFAAMREDGVLTLAGAGDPLLHPDVLGIIAAARHAGVASVHVATDLIGPAAAVDGLLESGADVISVHLCAETAQTYRAVMGADQFEQARANLVRLLERRASRPGPLPTPWIVPRITRCDETYPEIEGFYDRWVMLAGAAAIDAPSAGLAGRIEALPLPRSASERFARERMIVLSDGHVLMGDRPVADALRDGVVAAWRKAISRREHGILEPKHATPVHGGLSRARVARLETA